MSDPTTRFSDRVTAYAAARPTYPAALVDALWRETGVAPTATVADVGAGTGIFSRLLLDAGATVYAVEPNAPMRDRAVADLGRHPRFRAVAACAEATTLPDASVDLVTAAQAFHWFKHAAAAVEFRRILRPPRPVALIWNDRPPGGTPFLDGYEALLRRHCPDYTAVSRRNLTPDDFRQFFGQPPRLLTFPNPRRVDEAMLITAAFSASYAPRVGTPAGDAFATDLRALFATTAVGGAVEFSYTVQMYVDVFSG